MFNGAQRRYVINDCTLVLSQRVLLRIFSRHLLDKVLFLDLVFPVPAVEGAELVGGDLQGVAVDAVRHDPCNS